MANILVLGVGPLPVDVSTTLHAPGIRTWHITEMLTRQKHRVIIGLISFGDFDATNDPGVIVGREDYGERVTICHLRYNEKKTPQGLATLHVTHQFTCIISTTDLMNGVAADIPIDVPLWLDYNGDPFAEKQLQGLTYNNDTALMNQWKLYLKGLLAGDRFSTASEAQKYALMGQLGFAGRLNQYTAGEDLVHCVPNSSRVMWELGGAGAPNIKGRFIPADSRILMWLGGYNSWSDPETLFYGVEKAMRQMPNLFFVSTGGAITGHDTATFARFKMLVDESDLVTRFLFLGWLPTNEITGYLKQADACVCIDRYSYEGELGARTRINDWLQFQVPVISTALCEMTRKLESRDLMYSFEIANPDSLSAAILKALQNPEEAKEKARLAKAYFATELEEERAFRPMIEWAANPVFAGDRVLAESEDDAQEKRVVDSQLAMIHKQMASPETIQRSPVLKRLFRKVMGRPPR